MIQYHIYPGGVRRALLFSYDDGHEEDARLISLMNKYGVKGSFHLNGVNYIGITPERRAELRARYAGHEISCHTLRHGWPARMPSASLVGEVMSDRRILEKIAGYPVTGMSYPSGSYADASVETLRACGIVYSRTTKNTGSFALPEDFLRWHPTCHHRDALPLCDKFLSELDSEWTHPLFNIWGHSFEFRTEADWAYIEEVIGKLANNPKIWYATYMDFYNYTQAVRMLKISVDEDVFENPTATDVWVEKDKKQIIRIPAGATVHLEDVK